LIVTIDGPAAAGKSTVARRLARRLGFRYLDTGAMYRAATWKALRCGADLEAPETLAEVVRNADIQLKADGRVLCDGQDVTQVIRSPEVTGNIYRVADDAAARQALIRQQRKLAATDNLVAEGRDQGSEVFPDAEVKFYLHASLKVRAGRRLDELRNADKDVSLAEVQRQIVLRDRRDRSRPVGSLRRTGDMIFIDSTDLSVEQVVQVMLDHVEDRLAGGPS